MKNKNILAVLIVLSLTISGTAFAITQDEVQDSPRGQCFGVLAEQLTNEQTEELHVFMQTQREEMKFFMEEQQEAMKEKLTEMGIDVSELSDKPLGFRCGSFGCKGMRKPEFVDSDGA